VVHFVAATQPLASAVTHADRLTAGRAPAVAVCASGDSVVVASDCVFGDAAAVVYEPGTAVVGLRALATVLNGLTAPEAEVRVEGTRLAVRTPTARFALPLMATPPLRLPDLPVLGVATGLRDAATVVAEATAKDSLPLFAAVRLRSGGDQLTLVATDRFRAAIASVAWDGEGEVDALVPAAALAAAMRFAGPQVPVRSTAEWFGVDWPGGGTVMPRLAVPFPDAQIASLLAADPIATVEVDADTLRSAVDRVAPFAPDGIALAIADGVVSVRGDGELGDAREDVKASTVGDHTTTRYQPRYLADALRAYAGAVRIHVQQGIRPTVFSAGELRYLVVPLQRRGG
jgi:DNA polymerase-3 subunit beta